MQRRQQKINKYIETGLFWDTFKILLHSWLQSVYPEDVSKNSFNLHADLKSKISSRVYLDFLKRYGSHNFDRIFPEKN